MAEELCCRLGIPQRYVECGFCGAARSSTDGDHSRLATIQQFELSHIVSIAYKITRH